MILTRTGKCWGCKVKVQEPKEFLVPVDMLNPERRWIDIPAVREQVQTWRYSPLWCGPDYCLASTSHVGLGNNNKVKGADTCKTPASRKTPQLPQLKQRKLPL